MLTAAGFVKVKRSWEWRDNVEVLAILGDPSETEKSLAARHGFCRTVVRTGA